MRVGTVLLLIWLIIGAIAAGQRDKGVRQIRHHRLALMHRTHHTQFRQSQVRNLLVHKSLRNHTDDPASLRQARIREHTHQPHIATSVNQLNATPAQQPADGLRRLSIYGMNARTRPTKYADAL